MPDELVVASVNVNGVRAAFRRGMGAWLAEAAADVLALQEVRASDAVLRSHFDDGWQVAHAEPVSSAGRAGVAVLSRLPIRQVRGGEVLGEPFAGLGRWIEADLDGGPTVVSVYVHTGEAGTARQTHKEAFLDAVTGRLEQLAADGEVLVCGDFNITHTDGDLKNWKANRARAGCLPSERAVLDAMVASGWTDVVRALHGPPSADRPGPYTWWSWRGRAFDNDAGWRIDYHWATAELARRALSFGVHRADSYEARFSDHAPVQVRYGR